MKKQIFGALLLVTLLFVTSCKNDQADTDIENNYMTKVDSLDMIKQQKIEIDSFVVQNPKNLTILVKRIDHSDLFQIENEKFPDDVETTFNLVKDKTGRIIYICEIPNSESGDWFVTLNHYFDENGKTFAFEKHTSSFASVCAEITYETKVEYFDSDFKSIGNDYKLVDDKKKKINPKDCDLMDYPDKILPKVDDFLKTNRIKKKHTIYKENNSEYHDETDPLSTDVNIHVKNYISACIEEVNNFTPNTNRGFVTIFNEIFGNDQNFVNKSLLKAQLSGVLTNKEQRDLFFIGHLKFFRDKSRLYMNVSSLNDYTYSQFDAEKLTDFIIQNYDY